MNFFKLLFLITHAVTNRLNKATLKHGIAPGKHNTWTRQCKNNQMTIGFFFSFHFIACNRTPSPIIMRFLQYLWASISVDFMKISVSRIRKVVKNNHFNKMLYLKLYFSTQLISFISSVTHSTKICI